MSSCYTTDTGVHLRQLIRKSVKVSIHALKCAMIALRVTSPVEEEGAKEEVIAEAVEPVDNTRGRFDRNWALFHRTELASMAPMMVK